MSKQTAVEWLYQEITKKSVNDPNHNVLGILEQAKEMEKEQMIDAWEDGHDSFSTRSGEQCYNETFKG
jgi:hypothetical protein